MDYFFCRKGENSFSHNLTVMVCNLSGTMLRYGRQEPGSCGLGAQPQQTFLRAGCETECSTLNTREKKARAAVLAAPCSAADSLISTVASAGRTG